MVHWIAEEVQKLRSRFLGTVLPAVTEQEVEQAFRGFRVRRRVYDAWSLFRVFLAQVSAGDSCRAAVELGIQQEWLGSGTCVNTSAYCNARAQLPEEPLRRLAFSVGRALSGQAEQELWRSRRVKVADGTSFQLPDTLQNQAEYPQPEEQSEGCGFPVMHACALMCLSTGAILDVETCGGSGHERKLFRALWRSLERGDVVLGDAGFGSYAEMAQLQQLGVDCVFRKQQGKLGIEKGQRLGSEDWLVTWECPREPGAWVDRSSLPETLRVRVIRFGCPVKGFRSQEVVLVTTLLDPKLYPKRKLMELYRRRWEMELRFRDIKTTMGLEMLSCKTPAGCRKELWMGLVAYNLIRTVMVDAARRWRVRVSRISFAGTVQRLIQFGHGNLAAGNPRAAYRLLLEHLRADLLPHRPNRVEPRKRKRRSNGYSLLTVPRHVARLRLLEA